MELHKVHRIYFIGIGGIGMSALARFFNERGAKVYGYDKTNTPLTEQLAKEGITITYSDAVDTLEKEVDVIIYTPAIPANHIQLNWYRNNNYEVIKRSDVLQVISNEMQAVCVAGTHGKTTISTFIAHILRYTQYGCNAFLGGISSNYNNNYWSSPNACAVIEADEYDRSFLKLNPTIAVVTAMDADHLDIYGTVEEMEKCYLQFITQIKDTLIYKHGLKHSAQFNAPNKVTYSLQNESATYYASNIIMKQGSYICTINKSGSALVDVKLNIGGMHNIENMVAAFAACDLLKIDHQKIAEAIQEFKGVKRRFEYILKNEKVVYIDDYAHHPEELKMLLSSAKSLFHGKKISVVFQPHLYTRTRDFCDGFAESLDIADEIILLDIYPAREMPIEGITSDIIYNKIQTSNKHIMSKEAVLQWIQASTPEIIITAGAGDIDTLIEPIKNSLMQK